MLPASMFNCNILLLARSWNPATRRPSPAPVMLLLRLATHQGLGETHRLPSYQWPMEAPNYWQGSTTQTVVAPAIATLALVRTRLARQPTVTQTRRVPMQQRRLHAPKLDPVMKPRTLEMNEGAEGQVNVSEPVGSHLLI
jgi:hypothetical protein